MKVDEQKVDGRLSFSNTMTMSHFLVCETPCVILLLAGIYQLWILW